MSHDGQAIVDRMNASRPAIIQSLGGSVIAADPDAGTCTMRFDISEALCHSTNVVQGGIITAMLDASMSHAVFARYPDVNQLSSLEIKVNFLEPSLAGEFSCRASIRRAGYKIAFLEGELYSGEGQLTATATTTAKLGRAPS